MDDTMDDDDYICSVEAAINEIGGKWKSLVLCALKDGKLRFSEINRKIPRITQRMLTKTLRELEANGLINRIVYPEVPPRVEYSLTEKGKSVIPILDELCEWGKRYGTHEK
ncbi:winged helix-turn-helix transcriptional regulator [Methanothermobacter sp.]|uniref:winged helix-turn-helix transcriptional regulator n=2 Tax=Methanothermobacter sp. TaxID=1884223 RepID=UPI00261128F2|nr:winged helix-turn-helix transcriptional regulator [Methanothermobacter sp.]MDI9614797.1 winged helix-turn-helix transcriptional regulator [Methanothermobacter sp.]